MSLYIKRSDGCYCQYIGMTQDQIIQAVQAMNLTCEFISETEYSVIVEASEKKNG